MRILSNLWMYFCWYNIQPHALTNTVQLCITNRCGVVKATPGIATATLTYTWMLSTEQVNALVNNGFRLICNWIANPWQSPCMCRLLCGTNVASAGLMRVLCRYSINWINFYFHRWFCVFCLERDNEKLISCLGQSMDGIQILNWIHFSGSFLSILPISEDSNLMNE